MNTANNKRRKESRRRMENVFVEMLQDRELDDIRVTDICREAEVNRTTFYANYQDIYDLAEAVQKRLEADVMGLYQQEVQEQHGNHDFLRLFYHIRENQLFYKTYFKLNHDGQFRFAGYSVEDALKRFENRHIEYHIAFFGNGLNAVLKMWLQNGCKESPEEIREILREEYSGIFEEYREQE